MTLAYIKININSRIIVFIFEFIIYKFFYLKREILIDLLKNSFKTSIKTIM